MGDDVGAAADFLNLLRRCVVPGVEMFSEWDMSSLYRPAWMVRNLARGGMYFVEGLGDSSTVAAMQYVRGCCGHRVEGEILKYPRLSALWAGTRVGGRWRRGEGVISSDHLAMWMYSSRVLGGRLPSAMHNRMVMESYFGRTPAMEVYLASVVAQKKGVG